jgi:hypothetical protein
MCEKRRCALRSLGSLKLISKRTSSISVRGAAHSVPRMSLSLHQGKVDFCPSFVYLLF